jgi:hypothetical protein
MAFCYELQDEIERESGDGRILSEIGFLFTARGRLPRRHDTTRRIG